MKRTLVIVFATAALCQAGEQLLNLPDSPTNRFEITDRVWPATAGEADICLWKDDKLAAVTITIDDNNASDHEWWVAQGSNYNWKFTWFVISGRPSQYSTGFNGIWHSDDDPTYEGPSWNDLHNMGHDIQSHTVTHLHAGEPGRQERDAASVTNIETEYSISIEHIETFIPGHQCTMLAYPGNSNPSVTNDPAVAVLYYSGARTTSGHIDVVNQMEYLMTKSAGGSGVNTGDWPPWNDINWILDPDYDPPYTTNNYPQYANRYRGWYTVLFHGVSDKVEATNDFIWVKDREEDIWVGTYSDVVRYGQERDSATLTVTENTATQIRFTLSDRMLDTVFTMPLTAKVRLPNDWTAVDAVQGGGAVDATVVEHDGGKYAFVQAVPDQGEVLMEKGGNKGTAIILR